MPHVSPDRVFYCLNLSIVLRHVRHLQAVKCFYSFIYLSWNSLTMSGKLKVNGKLNSFHIPFL